MAKDCRIDKIELRIFFPRIIFAKLYVVEEINETKKLYLNKIEMVSTDSTDSAKALSQNSSVDTINNVSDLFDFVKNNNDKFESDSAQPTKFNPKPVNKEFINSDGTPKIFYHGTTITIPFGKAFVLIKNNIETANGGGSNKRVDTPTKSMSSVNDDSTLLPESQSPKSIKALMTLIKHFEMVIVKK